MRQLRKKKHSTWSFQCDVKTREKKRLNIIWNNKLIMHTKTLRKINLTSMINQRVVNEDQSMFSLVMFHLQTDYATQQNTQYEFTLMSLNLNKVINRFFVLSIIINKRNHFQDSTNVLLTIFRRSFSVV
jgi:hypothetical protein